jgi:glycosyltransferase involved in cell wall biosynthesis
MLAVIETHPVQYHAPVYNMVQARFGIPVAAIYGSDFSVAGYADLEFGESFAWDTDLLAGYGSSFLSRVSNGGERSFDKVSPKGLSEALRQVNPAAVLVVGYAARFYRSAMLHSLSGGYPLLFRGETTDHARIRNRPKAWFRDLALRWLYRRCAKLLYIGQRSLDHFRRLACPSEKLVFSPYCVDSSQFDCSESDRDALRWVTRDRLDISSAQNVLLFSGKLVSRKGPDLLLRAVKALPKHIRRSVVVLFLGSGGLSESLESLAGSSPEVDARFLGFQNQSQLSCYYQAADLLVLPSTVSETWGLVVNEALHHGLPCVVSEAVGCAPDLVSPGVTGEVSEIGSVRSSATAIHRGLDLVGRSEIRTRCREIVDGYTVEKAAVGIAQAYHGVTGGAGRLRGS